MKKTLIIFLFLISISSFSQYKGGTIYFRDNSKISGQIKIAIFNRVKLKKGDQKLIYNYEKVKKVIFNDSTEFHYKKRKNSFLLLEKEISGKLELFSRERASAPTANGMGSFSYHGGGYTQFFISKKSSNFIEKLPQNNRGKRFRKILSKYGSDCNLFLNKITDKKDLAFNFDFSIFKIIKYYNENCNQ
ncbi:hypothetical protein [Tenacibaculum ovolyticum]|uniref:hypothetical protein n=1 Tax=Tenacibaculum ovolyticum TaxID=104270 RepID=UPI0007ED42FE|nr:hypothetical protein [Tenacibaculum ovolyticum]